jgi:succinate dehydrogenase/fumarate reductase flavoprotein subunit
LVEIGEAAFFSVHAPTRLGINSLLHLIMDDGACRASSPGSSKTAHCTCLADIGVLPDRRRPGGPISLTIPLLDLVVFGRAAAERAAEIVEPVDRKAIRGSRRGRR